MELAGLSFRCTKCSAVHSNAETRHCLKCRLDYQREYRKRVPPTLAEKAKLQARRIANAAKRRGLLIPKPCELCASPKVTMHHEDYNKPTEVRWLCAPCHRDEHDREANKRLGKPEDWVFPDDQQRKVNAR